MIQEATMSKVTVQLVVSQEVDVNRIKSKEDAKKAQKDLVDYVAGVVMRGGKKELLKNSRVTVGSGDLKKLLEDKIVTVVSDLKSRAERCASAAGKGKLTVKSAGSILWENADTADIAYAAMDCGRLAMLFSVAGESGIMLSKRVEALRKWIFVIHPS